MLEIWYKESITLTPVVKTVICDKCNKKHMVDDGDFSSKDYIEFSIETMAYDLPEDSYTIHLCLPCLKEHLKEWKKT